MISTLSLYCSFYLQVVLLHDSREEPNHSLAVRLTVFSFLVVGCITIFSLLDRPHFRIWLGRIDSQTCANAKSPYTTSCPIHKSDLDMV